MKNEDAIGLAKDFRLFSATEVADILAVSQSHLCAMRNMPDEGGLPVMYVGSKRTPRYAMCDVVSFIKHGGTPLKRGALKMSSTIRRRVGKSGRISYQARVFSGKNVFVGSKTFDRRKDAVAWIEEKQLEFRSGVDLASSRTLVCDAHSCPSVVEGQTTVRRIRIGYAECLERH